MTRPEVLAFLDRTDPVLLGVVGGGHWFEPSTAHSGPNGPHAPLPCKWPQTRMNSGIPRGIRPVPAVPRPPAMFTACTPRCTPGNVAEHGDEVPITVLSTSARRRLLAT
jgi:hypothetical protein